MDRRAALAALAAAAGTGCGVIAAAGGAPVPGSIAAVACGLAGAAAVVNAQRATAAERTARAAELGRLLAEQKAMSTPAPAPPPAPEPVHDAETGLLDARVFAVTFESKVAAARRHLRPLALVLVDLAHGLPDEAGARSALLGSWGLLVRQTLRDSDVPCRVGDTTFAIICEDTPEAGAVWVAERLQIAAAARGVSSPFLAAVSTYPNHGLTGDDVLRRGWEALERARRAGRVDDRFSAVELPQPEA